MRKLKSKRDDVYKKHIYRAHGRCGRTGIVFDTVARVHKPLNNVDRIKFMLLWGVSTEFRDSVL